MRTITGLIGLSALVSGLLLAGCETAPEGARGPGGEYGTAGPAARDYGGSDYGAPPGELDSSDYVPPRDRDTGAGGPSGAGGTRGPGGTDGLTGEDGGDLMLEGGASGTGSELDR